MAKVEVGSLVSGSWEFFSKNISKLWAVALLLALPGVLSAFLVNPTKTLTTEDLSGITDGSDFTEAVFGVSVAEAGGMLLIWLLISVVYSAIVYGGSIHGVLAGLRGHLAELSLSNVWNAGWKRFGSLILLGIVLGAIIGVGVLLLVIPGIIAAFLLAFSPFFLVDKGQSVSQSMSSSYNTVKDNVGTVFLTWLAVVVINLAVSLVLGIFLKSNADLVRALLAVANGFVAVFTLTVVSKLYQALAGHSSSATSTE